ncbi:MAG: hypothetical protein P1U90_10105, partial [Akkermansiaceae bacterium]|nr:hypothetical protein [Akkermansiaceae bacterium]
LAGSSMARSSSNEDESLEEVFLGARVLRDEDPWSKGDDLVSFLRRSEISSCRRAFSVRRNKATAMAVAHPRIEKNGRCFIDWDYGMSGKRVTAKLPTSMDR